MAFEAFVKATVVGPVGCSPKAPTAPKACDATDDVKLPPRPRSAVAASFRRPLPSPRPPSTRLERERNPWRKKKKSKPKLDKLQQVLHPLHQTHTSQLSQLSQLPAPEKAVDRLEDLEPESPMSRCDSRKACRAKIRRPWREPPVPTSPKSDPLSPKSRWKNAVDAITARNSDLVKQRSNMSQSVRRRIRAFDERMAILANGGAKVAANENSDSESDQGDQKLLDLAFAMEQKEEKEELVEMPCKVISWSSQRGNFPAFNLLGTSSCWQSEIGMTRDQHLTFELEDVPAPLVAIQMEVVTKEVTPKRCKLMFSTNSPMGPWQTAWTFVVPEHVAERGLRFFNKSKEEIKSGMESAPWWRLAMADNYGSQACIAIAAPLKLLVEERGDHARLKQVKKTTISSFLDNFSFGQARLVSNLSAEEKMDKRLATTYKLDPEFIAEAHEHFNAMDRTKCGRWNKKDWQTWMVQFIPPRERNKATSERMTFFWNRMEKDADFTIDFEEFVIFLHVLNKTAEGFQMSFGELLFPGIVKKEVPEGQEEEVQKPQEETVRDPHEMSWKLSRNKQEELIRGVVAQNLPNRRGSLLGPMPEMPEISITQARRSDASRTRQKPKEPLNLARASLLFAQSGNPESDPGSP